MQAPVVVAAAGAVLLVAAKQVVQQVTTAVEAGVEALVELLMVGLVEMAHKVLSLLRTPHLMRSLKLLPIPPALHSPFPLMLQMSTRFTQSLLVVRAAQVQQHRPTAVAALVHIPKRSTSI